MNLHQQILGLRARRVGSDSERWLLVAEREKVQKGRKKNAFSTWELSLYADHEKQTPFFSARKLTLEECFSVLWKAIENNFGVEADHQKLDGLIRALDKEGVGLNICTYKTEDALAGDNSFLAEAAFETTLGDTTWNLRVPSSDYPPATALDERWMVFENILHVSFISN